MKILIDVQGAQSQSRYRGIGRATQGMAKAIISRAKGHDVSVLLNGSLTENLDELRSDFLSVLDASHILTFQVPGNVAEHDPDNLWRTRSAEQIREAFIAAQKPDILFVTSLFEGFLDNAVTSIGTFEAGHATAVTVHDLIPLLNPDQYLSHAGSQAHYLRKAQALKRADLLLAVSESSRQEAITALSVRPEQVVVVGNGVSPSFRQLHMPAERKNHLRTNLKLGRAFVLYVGAVDPRKNVKVLLQAFARLPAAIRSRHSLALAGASEPNEKQHLLLMAARYGLNSDELVFCGHVSENELVELYNTCALFVFPSRHEGFGLPLLEAMACGAPVLAANKTSLPEVLGRDDLLFDPDDPNELAAKMTWILARPGVLADLQNWGLQRAARFTWESSADTALQAFEALHTARGHAHGRAPSHLTKKKTLAFLSPLPDDRSGIAEYSARLLPELARFYDIECVIEDTKVTDPWIIANYAIRDIGWFERNAASYDRILYSIGNSHFHCRSFDLIGRFPGVVVLHDFFLSDVINWMASTGRAQNDEFPRELYRTHGMTALMTETKEGRLQAVERYACNDIVFRNAVGTIVHSQFAVDRAGEIYGPEIAASMQVIPFLHVGSSNGDRAAARSRLGLRSDKFIVCSFGLMTARKKTLDLLNAWIASPLNNRADAILALVGDVSDPAYGDRVTALLKGHKGASQIIMTGYAPERTYHDYLEAADLAVQLRTESRGETSAAILDCLAAGVPVIVNAHGPTNEVPDEVVYKLRDECTPAEIAGALAHFFENRDAARELGNRGKAHVTRQHHPSVVGDAFHDAIERFEQTSVVAQNRTLIRSLSDLHAPRSPTTLDVEKVALSISRNAPRVRHRQILCDVTVLAENDARTGIQRVVRSLVSALIETPPPGYRVEPVRIDGADYRYARRFGSRAFADRASVLPDSLVDHQPGDIFLGIDWVPDRLPQVAPWLQAFRNNGGKVIFGVYDLLPLQSPEYFPDFMADLTHKWFKATLVTADQFVCISQTVADDVKKFAVALSQGGSRNIVIDHFPLGSDLAASLPTRGIPSDAKAVLESMQTRRNFLMVGTIEPRKGHYDVVTAFDRLWQQGVDVGLVIVGKRGWMVEGVEELISRHEENGRRLFWLKGISDEMLDTLYERASALIAASYGEGFGLPLVEAARHDTPLIARDIPVFREVAGSHAFYFNSDEQDGLSRSLSAWLALDDEKKAPQSRAMPQLGWRDSAEQLTKAIFSDSHYERTVV